MKKHLLATSILALSAVAPNLYAHQAGDILVRAGAVTVTTGESSSSVKTTDHGDLNGNQAETLVLYTSQPAQDAQMTVDAFEKANRGITNTGDNVLRVLVVKIL